MEQAIVCGRPVSVVLAPGSEYTMKVARSPKLTCSARPYHSVIRCYCALIRLAARRERPNGFAIELEQRPPKPAFVLPEHFKSHVPLNFLAADNVVTLKPSCHFCLAESPRPLVETPFALFT
jgi:hypothetical protein